VPLPAARPARVDGQLALATSKPKPAGIQLASAEPAIAVVAAGADTTSASETGSRERPGKSANDVISERGYWQGPAQMEPVEAPTKVGPTRITSSPRRQTAVAGAEAAVVTASVAPWPLADRKGEEPLPSALAYAAQPDPIAVARPLPMGSGNTRAAPPAQGDTTIAVKRSDDRPTVTMPRVMPPRPGTSVVQTGDRFDDPWMRVMIVSPSAQSFMRMTLFGAQDFRKLGPHLHKPASVVMMTFSDDPHLGMSSEKFSGTAVVFVATMTFRPGRTAALR
jgi:hypothetical protein